MTQFNVGDIVTKKYGRKPAKIVAKCWDQPGWWECRYLHSKQLFTEYASDLKLYTEETEMTADTKTLYSFTVDNKVAYGTHIGTNSQNKYLIEEKTTGAIHILDKDQLEEVLPYTFSAKLSGSEQHYIGTPGTLKVNDILLCTAGNSPTVAVVTALDTKNKSARKFKGAKIVTEAI
jgi:hypothetical protein